MQKNFTKEFSFRTSRSSGPGGQNVNKVSSKVELLFHVDASKLLSVKEKALIKKKLNHRISVNGYLYLVCQDSRSQLKNRELVIERFYDLIGKSLVVQKKRIPMGTPYSVKEKRAENKRRTSQKKAMRAKVDVAKYQA